MNEERHENVGSFLTTFRKGEIRRPKSYRHRKFHQVQFQTGSTLETSKKVMGSIKLFHAQNTRKIIVERSLFVHLLMRHGFILSKMSFTVVSIVKQMDSSVADPVNTYADSSPGMKSTLSCSLNAMRKQRKQKQFQKDFSSVSILSTLPRAVLGACVSV